MTESMMKSRYKRPVTRGQTLEDLAGEGLLSSHFSGVCTEERLL